MAEQRPDLVTPLQPAPLACALAIAWKALWGTPASRESILTLLAQIRHETGFRSCHAYNLGNLKSVPGDGRDWVVFQTWERDASGARVAMMAKFRAYPTLAAGAADYLLLLRRKYGQAWTFVEEGKPAEFVRALKAQGYFTDLESTYEADVVRAYGLFAATLEFDTNPPYVDQDTANSLLALVATTAREETSDVLQPLEDRETQPDTIRTDVTKPDIVAVTPKPEDET